MTKAISLSVKEQFISLLRPAPSAPLLYCCVCSAARRTFGKDKHEAVLQNSLTHSFSFRCRVANQLQAMILVQDQELINGGTFPAFILRCMQVNVLRMIYKARNRRFFFTFQNRANRSQ